MTEEGAIQKDILEFLGVCNLFFWRNNTGGARKNGRYFSYGCPGSPDIEGILPNGIFFGIEVKTKDGIWTEKQRAFGEKVLMSGGVYILARSLADARPLMSHIWGRSFTHARYWLEAKGVIYLAG